MALNILSTWIIIILILIITISIVIFLIFTEKILRKKVVIKQRREENSTSRRIKLLISTNEEPKNKLRKINAIAKEIFRDFYGIDSKISYYELSEKFQKRGKKNHAKFCQMMFTILYSGEEIQSKKILELTKLLQKIEEDIEEERSLKELEKNMRNSIKNYPEKIDLLKKFTKIEDSFIDKFARDKKTIPQTQLTEMASSNLELKPLPKTPQISIESKTKREKLKNFPLIKLFRFRKNPGITLISKGEQLNQRIEESQIKIETSNFKKEEKPIEKSTYQIIEDLQKEVIERKNQIEQLRTKQQIKTLKENSENIEINKNESWPPVTFTPKHFNETKKMSSQTENSFQKMNHEIELLENEITNKKNEIRKLEFIKRKNSSKPSPIIKKFLMRINNKNLEKEISTKQKQINLINLKREPYPTYDAPKVVMPKKQKIEERPKMTSIKKEEYIHHVDNMDRIREKINLRRKII